jgi:hypothetical protein
MASSLPLPNILRTWAYSWPSSLKFSSRFSLLFQALAITIQRRGGWMGAATHSFSFFPLRRFLPPFPLFFGMLTERAQAMVRE